MDPIGNVPVFMSYLKDVKEERRTRIVARESVIALLILLGFLVLRTEADEAAGHRPRVALHFRRRAAVSDLAWA